jgi:hypothetical protein
MRQAREKVQQCEPFTANNVFAEVLDNGVYAVWSYGKHWPMFAKVGDQWFENSDKYSVTTSKQHGQCHPLCDTAKVGTAELQRVIR